MVNKEEQFYLRQHSFAIKKYEKSAEECKIAREARARMERRKTLISLNPPLSQPDFNRRMTKLSKFWNLEAGQILQHQYKIKQYIKCLAFETSAVCG